MDVNEQNSSVSPSTRTLLIMAEAICGPGTISRLFADDKKPAKVMGPGKGTNRMRRIREGKSA